MVHRRTFPEGYSAVYCGVVHFGLEQGRWINLPDLIQNRGFRYDSATCQMFVFGEYDRLCTKDIGIASRDQLALNPKSVHFLPSLSRPKWYASQALQAA